MIEKLGTGYAAACILQDGNVEVIFVGGQTHQEGRDQVIQKLQIDEVYKQRKCAIITREYSLVIEDNVLMLTPTLEEPVHHMYEENE